jgi:hypothetical protein
MTNQVSRKVLDGRSAALSFYVAAEQRQVRHDPVSGAKLFSFEGLYESVIEAVSRWRETYSGNLQKQLEFIPRYDQVLSEGRMGSMINP